MRPMTSRHETARRQVERQVGWRSSRRAGGQCVCAGRGACRVVRQQRRMARSTHATPSQCIGPQQTHGNRSATGTLLRVAQRCRSPGGAATPRRAADWGSHQMAVTLRRADNCPNVAGAAGFAKARREHGSLLWGDESRLYTVCQGMQHVTGVAERVQIAFVAGTRTGNSIIPTRRQLTVPCCSPLTVQRWMMVGRPPDGQRGDEALPRCPPQRSDCAVTQVACLVYDEPDKRTPGHVSAGAVSNTSAHLTLVPPRLPTTSPRMVLPHAS
jgi:hypothetical protein